MSKSLPSVKNVEHLNALHYKAFWWSNVPLLSLIILKLEFDMLARQSSYKLQSCIILQSMGPLVQNIF